MDHTMTVRQGALALLLLASPALFALTPGITITSPAEGTVVRPGGTVRITVNVDTALLQPMVIKVGAYMSIPGVFGILPRVEFSAPPYETDIAVPVDTSGILFVEARGRTTSGQVIDGPKIKIYVIPDEVPARLDISRVSMSLDLPKNPGDPLPTDLGMRTITVKGEYANNIRRNLSGSLFGTTYTSSDPAIVTVDAEGITAPVAPGIAFITVEHKGVKAFTEVDVEPLTGLLPPIDQTSKMNFLGGGFLFDRASGQYVQQVKITNQSGLPLPKPLDLVLTGLPTGVKLAEADGITKNVTPLGSPYADAGTFDGPFLPPGQSVTLTLRFFNYNNQSITYTPKLYTGNKL